MMLQPLHAFLSPVLFLFLLSMLSICTQVDMMHAECFSITYSSSMVLTWNTGAKCQGMGKDWKQLLQSGKAIVPVIVWFKTRPHTENTTLKAYLQSALLKDSLVLHDCVLVCSCIFQRHSPCTSKRISSKAKLIVLGFFSGGLSPVKLWCNYVSHCRQSAPTLILWSFTMTSLTIRCGCSAGEIWRRTSLLSR